MPLLKFPPLSLLLLCVPFLLTGCLKTTPPNPDQSQPALSLTAQTWQLSLVQGSNFHISDFLRYDQDPLITLTFSDHTASGEVLLSGQLACNSWKGQATITEHQLVLLKGGTTRKKCHYNDTFTQKIANMFLPALEQPHRYQLDHQYLTLRSLDNPESSLWQFQPLAN